MSTINEPDGADLPLLIGLYGPPGGGRSLVAAHLAARYGFRDLSLGEPLRDALLSLDPMLDATASLGMVVDKFGWKGAMSHRVYGPEVTRLIRRFTSVSRATYGPGARLVPAQARIEVEEGLHGAAPVVVTDIEFADEAEWIIGCGGVVWGVERPGCSWPDGRHEAWAELGDLASYVLSNDASVMALGRRVDRALASASTAAGRSGETPHYDFKGTV